MKITKIRKANKNDINKIREIANVPGLQIAGEERAPSKKWYSSFIKEKQMLYVAEDREEIIGFLTGEKVRDMGLLWEIGVKPEFRSKGIGSILLKKFKEECNKKKLRFIVAYGYLNKKTLDFFKHNNFIEGGTYKELRLDLKNY